MVDSAEENILKLNMTNFSFFNVSKLASNVTLAEVNDAMALTLLPAMLYVGIMMIVGFCGNSLVVYVFIFRFRRGTQNFLITCLAIFDLISCLVAMPTEITDIRYFYMFDSVFACKLLTFVTSFCAMCSVFTLLGIAIDRYIKVCRPLSNQVEFKHVQIWIAVVILVSVFFSWPSIVIYGIRSADTDVPKVIGRDCSTGDHVKDTSYPLIYNCVLAAGLIITTIILSVLYVMILRAIKVHRKHMRMRASFSNSIQISTIQMSCSNNQTNTQSTVHEKTSREKSFDKTLRRRNKTTVIAFLVTAVFVLSFLPHLALMCARSVIKDFDHDLRGSSLVAFNIFIRSYFINSVANPIIYGVLNYKFREECVCLIKRILLCRRRPVPVTQSFSTLS